MTNTLKQPEKIKKVEFREVEEVVDTVREEDGSTTLTLKQRPLSSHERIDLMRGKLNEVIDRLNTLTQPKEKKV